MPKSATLDIEPATAAALNKAVKKGYILLTRGGKPVAYVLPASIYDEEDIDYMTDPEFWKMIEERRKGPSVPFEVFQVELEEIEREEARNAGTRKIRTGRKKAG